MSPRKTDQELAKAAHLTRNTAQFSERLDSNVINRYTTWTAVNRLQPPRDEHCLIWRRPPHPPARYPTQRQPCKRPAGQMHPTQDCGYRHCSSSSPTDCADAFQIPYPRTSLPEERILRDDPLVIDSANHLSRHTIILLPWITYSVCIAFCQWQRDRPKSTQM